MFFFHDSSAIETTIGHIPERILLGVLGNPTPPPVVGMTNPSAACGGSWLLGSSCAGP